MEKVVQVRIDNDYLKEIEYIKKFLSKICLFKEEEITTSFILKYCINTAYGEIRKSVVNNPDYYKEKGL